MFQLEKQYIEYYHTTDRDKGYNISSGGDAGCFKGVNSGTNEYYRKRYKENSDVYKHRVMEHYYLNRNEINEIFTLNSNKEIQVYKRDLNLWKSILKKNKFLSHSNVFKVVSESIKSQIESDKSFYGISIND